jgi:hypothetical protein
MTGDTKPRTLKDQLESEIADTEREAAENPEKYDGGDWWQSSESEESVFAIDRERFPRMMMTWHCYEGFKLIADAPTVDDELIKQARQLHPEWCGADVSAKEFSDFAKEYGGLTHREAYAFYAKNDAWCTRHGVTMYKDGS